MGFFAALSLAERLKVLRPALVNLHALQGAARVDAAAGACAYFQGFDAVFVKSNWEWVVDAFAREMLGPCAVPRSTPVLLTARR